MPTYVPPPKPPTPVNDAYLRLLQKLDLPTGPPTVSHLVPKPGGYTCETLEVIVADKSDVTVEVTTHFLEYNGIQNVTSVGNGRELIMALEQSSFDLVLTSINMPLISGIDAVRYICNRFPEGKRPIIIGMSGDHSYKDECLKAGMAAFLTKPFDLDALVQTIVDVFPGIEKSLPKPHRLLMNRPRVVGSTTSASPMSNVYRNSSLPASFAPGVQIARSPALLAATASKSAPKKSALGPSKLSSPSTSSSGSPDNSPPTQPKSVLSSASSRSQSSMRPSAPSSADESDSESLEGSRSFASTSPAPLSGLLPPLGEGVPPLKGLSALKGEDSGSPFLEMSYSVAPNMRNAAMVRRHSSQSIIGQGPAMPPLASPVSGHKRNRSARGYIDAAAVVASGLGIESSRGDSARPPSASTNKVPTPPASAPDRLLPLAAGSSPRSPRSPRTVEAAVMEKGGQTPLRSPTTSSLVPSTPPVVRERAADTNSPRETRALMLDHSMRRSASGDLDTRIDDDADLLRLEASVGAMPPLAMDHMDASMPALGSALSKATAESRQRAKEMSEAARRMALLYVENVAHTERACVGLLRRLGFKLVVVPLSRAVEAASRSFFEVILVNVDVADSSMALKTISRVSGSRPSTVIAMCHQDVREACLAAGAAEAILKPVRLKDLENMLLMYHLPLKARHPPSYWKAESEAVAKKIPTLPPSLGKDDTELLNTMADRPPLKKRKSRTRLGKNAAMTDSQGESLAPSLECTATTAHLASSLPVSDAARMANYWRSQSLSLKSAIDRVLEGPMGGETELTKGLSRSFPSAPVDFSEENEMERDENSPSIMSDDDPTPTQFRALIVWDYSQHSTSPLAVEPPVQKEFTKGLALPTPFDSPVSEGSYGDNGPAISAAKTAITSAASKAVAAKQAGKGEAKAEGLGLPGMPELERRGSSAKESTDSDAKDDKSGSDGKEGKDGKGPQATIELSRFLRLMGLKVHNVATLKESRLDKYQLIFVHLALDTPLETIVLLAAEVSYRAAHFVVCSPDQRILTMCAALGLKNFMLEPLITYETVLSALRSVRTSINVEEIDRETMRERASLARRSSWRHRKMRGKTVARSDSMSKFSVSASEAVMTPRRAIKVLLACSTIVQKGVIQEMLAGFGCRVHTVDNGLKLVVAMQGDSTFDICLTDVRLPLMDGLEATRKIREAETDSRAIIVGLSGEDMSKQCASAGMDAFLEKPFSMERLGALLCAYVNRARLAAFTEPGCREYLDGHAAVVDPCFNLSGRALPPNSSHMCSSSETSPETTPRITLPSLPTTMHLDLPTPLVSPLGSPATATATSPLHATAPVKSEISPRGRALSDPKQQVLPQQEQGRRSPMRSGRRNEMASTLPLPLSASELGLPPYAALKAASCYPPLLTSPVGESISEEPGHSPGLSPAHSPGARPRSRSRDSRTPTGEIAAHAEGDKPRDREMEKARDALRRHKAERNGAASPVGELSPRGHRSAMKAASSSALAATAVDRTRSKSPGGGSAPCSPRDAGGSPHRARPSAPAPPARAAISPTEMRILLADRDEVSRQVMIASLELLGYAAAKSVSDGNDVIAAIRASPFDVVLMGIKLQGLDGIQTASRITKEFGPNGPLMIGVTGMSDVTGQCREAGMLDVVEKPFEIEQIDAVLKRCAVVLAARRSVS